MDFGTIAPVLLALGAFAVFLILVRQLPPAEDDVAAVVAAVVGTPVELEKPSPDHEEPVRWRIDVHVPRPAARSVARPQAVARPG